MRRPKAKVIKFPSGVKPVSPDIPPGHRAKVIRIPTKRMRYWEMVQKARGRL